MSRIFFFFLLISLPLSASVEGEFAVLYKGRFRPADAYARLWLYDLYHAQSLKNKDLPAFHTDSSLAIDLLWDLHFFGHTPFIHAPLFWIQSAEVKQLANLDLLQNRFNYSELSPLPSSSLEEMNQLHASLLQFSELKGSLASNLSTDLLHQLRSAGSLFKSLPSRHKSGDWYSLHALKVLHRGAPVKNFTLFTDHHFTTIREHYLHLESAWLAHADRSTKQALQNQLASALLNGYQQLAGTPYQEAEGKSLHYPTVLQLKMESWYYTFPFIKLLILLYSLSALLLIWNTKGGTALFGFSFFCHCLLLACRSYILGRPPVSNMSETVIYVPWVAAFVSLFLRKRIILIAASFIAITLLSLLEITDLNNSLDQVQAVLDSQFWLLIHVLMIVGSYGVFLLAAILGHFYLGLYLYHHLETPFMKSLAQMILQTLYLGTALLIPGTILGGVWAAESWGRFWDWDPKESWAFISICFYLICIHAFRFHRISSFGLAVGAVSGSLAISFTWYGVNYILGTGLHSYGFGSGGEGYYYIFLLTELSFLSITLWSKKMEKRNHSPLR